MFKPKEIKKRIRTPLVFIALILISLTILQFCGKEKDTVLVSSGTYTGIVTKIEVELEKMEDKMAPISVKILDK